MARDASERRDGAEEGVKMERNALTHDASNAGELAPPRERRAAKLAAWLAWSLAGLSLAMFVAGFALYAAVLSESSTPSWGTGGSRRC